MRTFLTAVFSAMLLLIMSGCYRLYDLVDRVEPISPRETVIATDLVHPIGMELDFDGRIWVTEVGTGNNDGQITLIKPGGEKVVVAEGFASLINPEGEVAGLNHLMLFGDWLYVLHGPEGRLYKIHVGDNASNSSDWPLQASEIPYEDIGSFVLAYEFEEDTEESNLYNLTTDLNGNFYITDAAANAIIKREAGSGDLSVFATFPAQPNPLPFGPPVVQQVPTGIVFDGDNFLVSSLQGFPFPEGFAKVYKVNKNGDVSVFQDGLTSLVDIELAADRSAVVAEYARFGDTGFAPNTGQLVNVTPKDTRVLVEGLNFPTDVELELADPRILYVNSLTDGVIKKIEL